jgi:hypothetical protein
MHRSVTVALALAVALAVALVLPGVGSAQTDVEEPAVRQAIEAVLDMEVGRSATRLPRVSLDSATGDLTVVFAMRRPLSDDAGQIVASATNDIFNILWATYTSEAASRIRTTTVLGTYAVVGRYSRPREIPLVRAVLSDLGAARMNWARAAILEPRDVFDVWWVEGELVAADPR